MSDQPIIVIKKVKKVHGGHHGGAWKAAYADFVTAMMAFFLVMWLVGQSQEVKAGVASYFRDPGGAQFEGGPSETPTACIGATVPKLSQSTLHSLYVLLGTRVSVSASNR